MKRRRPSRAKAILLGVALSVAFITGAASSLLYVYLHPVTVVSQVTGVCMFKLPPGMFEPL